MVLELLDKRHGAGGDSSARIPGAVGDELVEIPGPLGDLGPSDTGRAVGGSQARTRQDGQAGVAEDGPGDGIGDGGRFGHEGGAHPTKRVRPTQVLS